LTRRPTLYYKGCQLCASYKLISAGIVQWCTADRRFSLETLVSW